MNKKVLTLVIIEQNQRVLLGMKKRGFGEGRWNGFGGKVEAGETIEVAARRELKEEIGLEAGVMEKMGILDFSFASDPMLLEVHIFKVGDYIGEPQESEEMKPEWFSFAEIPFQDMWSDDEIWLPYLLASKRFKGRFHFDQPSTPSYAARILEQELQEIERCQGCGGWCILTPYS